MDPEQVQDTQSLLVSLEKTYRTLRLYTGDNEICRQREDELEAQVTAHLDAWGELEVEVNERSLRVGDEVAYDAGDRTDSLPFLLFRDGVRALALLPGVDRDELHRFVEAIVLASRVASDDDDLITLLWERDLQHIRCVAVDELGHQHEGPRLDTQLAERSLRTADHSDSSAPPVSVADLSQPVTHLPVTDCQLSEAEIESLHAELATEERDDHLLTVADLAIELSLLEPDEDERSSLLQTLVRVVERGLAEAPLSRMVEVLDHVNETCARLGTTNAGSVGRELLKALARPGSLDILLARIESAPHLAPPSATCSYLAMIGPQALPELIPRISTLPHAEYRRAAADAVLAAGAWGIEALRDHVSSAAALEPDLVPEILHVARSHGGSEALPLLEALLDQPDGERRLQAARALGPFHDGPIGQAWISLLDDDDAVMRELALSCLLRSRRPELAQPIAERTMLPEFADRPAEEKRLAFEAVARLGGDSALPWLRELLEQPQGGWFTSRHARETLSAVAHAIATVGSTDARETLSELVRVARHRSVRAACKAALREWPG